MRKQLKISCVNPAIYQNRFIKFIRKEMLYQHKTDSRKVFMNEEFFDIKFFFKEYGNEEEKKEEFNTDINKTLLDQTTPLNETLK